MVFVCLLTSPASWHREGAMGGQVAKVRGPIRVGRGEAELNNLEKRTTRNIQAVPPPHSLSQHCPSNTHARTPTKSLTTVDSTVESFVSLLPRVWCFGFVFHLLPGVPLKDSLEGRLDRQAWRLPDEWTERTPPPMGRCSAGWTGMGPGSHI